MHRAPLLAQLLRYGKSRADEQPTVGRVCEFVRNHPDCFERSCIPGHVTGSAWIVSADRERFLLTHHGKLDRWLQLGGHADGESDVRLVALREAREESGMQAFEWLGPREAGFPLPIDVDVHRIPARPGEPAHDHYDIRFLLAAAPGQKLRVSEESKALEWFEWDQLEHRFDEESLLRLGRKARATLASGGGEGPGSV